MRFLEGVALVLAFGVGAMLAAFGSQPLDSAGLLPDLPDRPATVVAPASARVADAEEATAREPQAAPLALASGVADAEARRSAAVGASQLAEALRITRGLLAETRESLDSTREETDALRRSLAASESDRRRLEIALNQARAELGLPPLPSN